MARLPVTHHLTIDDELIEESFVAASGPGGQNVNKVATAVVLRFRLSQDRSLPDDVKQRLRRRAGQRLTLDGDIVLRAQQYRTRERNREDALDRLLGLIRASVPPPVPRRPTKPSEASQRKRVDSKIKRGRIKALRGARADHD